MLRLMNKTNLDSRSSISSPTSTVRILSTTWLLQPGATTPAPKPKNRGSSCWCARWNPIAKESPRSRSFVSLSQSHLQTRCTTAITKSRLCFASSFTNKNRKKRRSRRNKPTRSVGGCKLNTVSAPANLTSVFTKYAPKFSKKSTARMMKV